MPYTTLKVLGTDKAGDETLALETGADTQVANGFEFVNDGATVLKIIEGSGAAEEITLEAIKDRYDRSEDTLTYTIDKDKTYIFGPWLPEIWNIEGNVRFKFTKSAAAATTVLAISVANPT